MEPAKRIVVNTLAQHIRSILNTLLSLYSTRLILQALGQYDYGVYMLIAGVVALLGFITSSLVVTTQRQISFLHGKGDMTQIRQMFSNCLLMHICLGVLLAVVLIAIKPLLFNGFLVVEPSRLAVAGHVYLLVILSLFITFLTAPYRALFVARENIVYISVVDVLDGVLKLGAALWLLQCPYDRLIAYAWVVVGIMAFNWIALAGGSKLKFIESMLLPRLKDINKKSMSSIFDFAGWTVYGMGCIAFRNQGAAVLLNQFFGALINTAYGIANQVYGAIVFIGASVVNAMSPQIIKAEGNGERERMLQLATLCGKYTYLLLSLVTIPLIFEMPAVLKLWLGEVPENTVLLCRFILVIPLVDQLTIGLGTANQAIGKIRNYSLLINTTKLITLPAMWIALKCGGGVAIAMWCYFVIELICSIIRLPFLKITAGLSILNYIKSVYIPIVFPTCIQILACIFIISAVGNQPLRFFLTSIVSVASGVAVIWFFTLSADERQRIISMIRPCR